MSVFVPRLSLPWTGVPAGHSLRAGFLRAGWPHAAGRQREERGEKSCQCSQTPGPPVLPLRKTKDVLGRRHTHAPPWLRREGGRDRECLSNSVDERAAYHTARWVCLILQSKKKNSLASLRALEISRDCCGHVQHTINREQVNSSSRGGGFQKALWEMELNRNCSDRLTESRTAESKWEHFITHTKKSFFCYRNELHLWGNPLVSTKKNCLSFCLSDLICKQSVEVQPGFQEVIWAGCYLTTSQRDHSSAGFLVIFLKNCPQTYLTFWYKLSGSTYVCTCVWMQIMLQEDKLLDAAWIQTLCWLPKQNRFQCVYQRRNQAPP